MVLLGAIALGVVAAPKRSDGSIRPPASPVSSAAAGFLDQPVIPGFGPTGPSELATVVRVVDGDTIRVRIGDAEQRLRYIGMDTPESVAPGASVEPYASAASAANSRLVEGAQVVLEHDVSETDRFGRLLRHVWLERPDGWLLVDLELIRLGFAHVATFPPDVKYVELYLAAERAARGARRGLWADVP